MKTTRLALPLIFAALLLSACGRSQPAPTDRAGRLLSMAAEEAANIPIVLDRFSRQLNIADTQLRTSRQADAAKTLALARDTLTVTKKEDFDDFHRIAGWTALSQLSRRANDRDLALKASDLALAALNDVQPAAERPQYVLSLAGELADLRGNDAAIELLNSGGAWAADLMDASTRRIALVAFTDRLLGYEAFENARTMLRRDPDPAWRTDTFLALANHVQALPDAQMALHNNANALREVAQAAKSPAPVLAADAAGGGGRGGRGGGGSSRQNTFGKDVRFENVYQNNQ